MGFLRAQFRLLRQATGKTNKQAKTWTIYCSQLDQHAEPVPNKYHSQVTMGHTHTRVLTQKCALKPHLFWHSPVFLYLGYVDLPRSWHRAMLRANGRKFFGRYRWMRPIAWLFGADLEHVRYMYYFFYFISELQRLANCRAETERCCFKKSTMNKQNASRRRGCTRCL